MNRRNALKWLTSSAAAAAGSTSAATGETEPAPVATLGRHPLYDPDYSKSMAGPWERLFSKEELELVSLLADWILPKDELGPSATEVGVPEFINEWISAPYPEQKEHCEIVRGGLSWVNTESFRRHGSAFSEAGREQQQALLEDIANPQPKPEHAVGGAFFKLFRQLCLGGYYTHSSTWKQLGYAGNISVAGPYPGVPQKILDKLGL